MVIFEFDKQRSLVLKMYGLKRLKALNINPFNLDFDNIDAEIMVNILYTAMLHEDKTVTPNYVEKIIDEQNIAWVYIMEIIAKLIHFTVHGKHIDEEKTTEINNEVSIGEDQEEKK